MGPRGSSSRRRCALRPTGTTTLHREPAVAGMPSVYRGHTGLREWFAELREAWKFSTTRRSRSSTRVMIAFLCKIRLRGRTSGIELDSRLGQVFWIEGGLIVRERDFSDWDEALRALGVPTRAEVCGNSAGSPPRNVNRSVALRENPFVSPSCPGWSTPEAGHRTPAMRSSGNALRPGTRRAIPGHRRRGGPLLARRPGPAADHDRAPVGRGADDAADLRPLRRRSPDRRLEGGL